MEIKIYTPKRLITTPLTTTKSYQPPLKRCYVSETNKCHDD